MIKAYLYKISKEEDSFILLNNPIPEGFDATLVSSYEMDKKLIDYLIPIVSEYSGNESGLKRMIEYSEVRENR